MLDDEITDDEIAANNNFAESLTGLHEGVYCTYTPVTPMWCGCTLGTKVGLM